jgi:hypothetical protein
MTKVKHHFVCIVSMKNDLDEIAFGCFSKINEWNLASVNNLLAITVNNASATLNGSVNLSCAYELLNQRIKIKHIWSQ